MKVNKIGTFLAMAAMASNNPFIDINDTPTRFEPTPEYKRKTCKTCKRLHDKSCPSYGKFVMKPKSPACSSYIKRKK